jgi:2'-hydroxyisoflavone reductase
MDRSRREFLQLAASGALFGLGLPGFRRSPLLPQGGRSLRLLILGGTGFIGPHMVQYALSRGHTVTLFNRGRTNTHLFPDVEKLVGDRNGDLEALKGRTWDAVIDNSASTPIWVRYSAQLLKDSVDTYVFTSTRSVYSDVSQVGLTEETGPVHEVDRAMVDSDERIPYGPAKVLCEMEANEAMPGRTLIIRPGLIVGPGDTTDRFTYWPARIDRGGEVLAPGDPENPVMYIDVRDLAEWYIHLLEQGALGVLNALGPESPLSFAELLYGIRAITSSPVSFTWVDTDFLLDRDIRPYSDMPLWRPARGESAGFQRFDLTKPLAMGIKYRPLAVTAKDTLDYHYSRPMERQQQMRPGITAERERELLDEWHAAGY